MVDTRTQTHSSYLFFTPCDSWDNQNLQTEERLQVFTYIQKSRRTQQHQPMHNQDLLQLTVNEVQILNIYQEPTIHEIMNYIINLMPSPCYLIGGDFNAIYNTFNPGADNQHYRDELIQQASSSGMSFINKADNLIQAARNILNLIFSNIPFAYTFL